MANGGWYGTKAEWERLESPLLRVDPTLSQFASKYGLILSKNHKGRPERSMQWGRDPFNLIQLYLADEQKLSWNLWIASTQDRDLERFWRQERMIDSQPMEAFEDQLTDLLEKAHQTVTAWCKKPENFEFAGPIQPLS